MNRMDCLVDHGGQRCNCMVGIPTHYIEAENINSEVAILRSRNKEMEAESALRLQAFDLATAEIKRLREALEKICDDDTYECFCGDDCIVKAQAIAIAALEERLEAAERVIDQHMKNCCDMKVNGIRHCNLESLIDSWRKAAGK